MKRSKSPYDLNENVPNFLLFDICFSLLVATDFLEDIAVVRILHHEAERGRGFVNKCLLESNYVWMINRSEDTDLVEGILFLFVSQIEHLDFFESVLLLVVESPYFIHGRVCPVPKLLYDGKVPDPVHRV